MAELVSYVCIRADHQWGTGESGRVTPLDGGVAWCPDSSLDDAEAHDWRACDPVPLASVTSLAAHIGAMESAVS
jgi:hypothetical protein